MDILLQFGIGSEGTLSVALTLVASVLGLAVGYIAFRGYRRNRSLPMLFVATGFLLAFWTPVLLLGGIVIAEEVARFAPGMQGTVTAAFDIAGDVSEIIGLLCILYGLWMPFER